jgi:hypothetical protein
MLLVHTTQSKYINDILADGKLKSFKQTGKEGEGQGDSDMLSNMVFLSVLFDFYKIFVPTVKSPVWLLFDAESTIKSKHPEHFCAAWDWGKYEENECVHYSSADSFKAMQKKWKADYKKRWSSTEQKERYAFGFPSADFAVNELVFKNSINLKGNLVGIYALNATWDHPLLMKRPEQLIEFLYHYGYKNLELHDWPIGLPDKEDLKIYKKYLRLTK